MSNATTRANDKAPATARAAVEEYLLHAGVKPRGTLTNADAFLAWLWREGFKVVPVEEPK